MAKSVRRDLHKMHAFLRFRAAWTRRAGALRRLVRARPFHPAKAAPFFVDRFRSMDWSILTPLGSLHWDRETLVSGPPGKRGDAPRRAMPSRRAGAPITKASSIRRGSTPRRCARHMPKKYWRNLPEAQSIPDLVRTAPSRIREMIDPRGGGCPQAQSGQGRRRHGGAGAESRLRS